MWKLWCALLRNRCACVWPDTHLLLTHKMTHISPWSDSAPIFTKCDYNLASLLLAVTEIERVCLEYSEKYGARAHCVIFWHFCKIYARYRSNVVYIFRCVPQSSSYGRRRAIYPQKSTSTFRQYRSLWYIELSAGGRIYSKGLRLFIFDIYALG